MCGRGRVSADTSMFLPISTIRTDGETQPRERLCEETVADYAEAMRAGSDFPPIVVFHDGSAHWLADGFHRLFAAKGAALSVIEADVRQGTRTDAIWYAIGANKANGQRPSRGDVKHAVLLALKTWPEKTQQSIADQIGCAQSMVAYAKRQFINVDKQPSAPATVTGRDGKTYPTSKPRRTKTEPQETEPMSPPSDAPAPSNKQPREVRARQIRELVAKGNVASQVATHLGISEQQVRNIAAAEGITLPDAALGKARRIDARRTIEETVLRIEAGAQAMQTVPMRFDDITKEEAAEWCAVLSDSLGVYRRFHSKLKEIAHG